MQKSLLCGLTGFRQRLLIIVKGQLSLLQLPVTVCQRRIQACTCPLSPEYVPGGAPAVQALFPQRQFGGLLGRERPGPTQRGEDGHSAGLALDAHAVELLPDKRARLSLGGFAHDHAGNQSDRTPVQRSGR